jgi:hypothetical protein
MKYTSRPANSLAITIISEPALTLSRVERPDLICPHCQASFETAPPPPRKKRKRPLWINVVQVVEKTQALPLARKAIEMGQANQLAGQTSRGRGAPRVYEDATILLTFIIAKLWHLSYEEILSWLGNWPELAVVLGYPLEPKTGQPRIISLGSYSKRLAALSLKVYFAFFVLVVGHLIKAGVITGHDLILDSTIVRAWSESDTYCAVSYKYRDANKRFGIKVHTVLDRLSGLPIMLRISPANANDSPFALPMLRAIETLWKLPVRIVRADAAYPSKALWDYVVSHLKAIWAVDYNLRRAGKKKLADRQQMKRWRWFMRPRATIERFFGWVKNHYKLKYFKVQGQAAIQRHVIATYIATLLVGWIAVLYNRPDLMHSPSRVLAYFDA